jgi:hypothetical protein
VAPPAPPPDMNAGPPPLKPAHKKDIGNSAGMDKDLVLQAGVAGIILVGILSLVALRRKRSRNSGVTQI